MPIYEYKCNICDHQLELIQKFGDAPLKTCPSCGQDSVRKLVSAAAFHLKGTGWYETDFKDKPKTKKNINSREKSKDSGEKKKTDIAGTGSKSSINKPSDNKSTDSPSKSAAAKPD